MWKAFAVEVRFKEEDTPKEYTHFFVGSWVADWDRIVPQTDPVIDLRLLWVVCGPRVCEAWLGVPTLGHLCVRRLHFTKIAWGHLGVLT